MPVDIPPLPFHALDQPSAEIERRFAVAHARGTPRWFWPELSVDAWMAARREVVRATGEVLAGRTAALDAEMEADAFGIAAFTMGMGPLLGWWIQTGALDAEPRTAALLALHLEHGHARAAKIDALLDSVLAALASAGVRTTVIKGMHTARALFPHPGTRPMSDIDLVVGPADVPPAEAALQAAGFARKSETYQRRPYHADFTPPGEDGRLRSLLLTHRDNPLGLNLHDHFDRFPEHGRAALGTPGAADLGEMPGSPARVLAGPFLVAYLAAHASEQRENLLLVRLVELVMAMRTAEPPALRDFLRARRMAHHVYPALALAERLAPGTLDADFLRWMEAQSGARVVRAVAELDLAALQRMDARVAGGRALGARGMMDRVRAALRWVVPHASAGRTAAVYRSRWGRLLALMRAR